MVVGPKAVPSLLRALQAPIKSHESGVIEALGWLRARAAVELLLGLLEKQRDNSIIHNALCEIGDSAAIPGLKGLLDRTKDQFQRAWLERTLDHLERHATS